jgi:tetratricopeptide (TPR) repeat protein
MKKTTALSSFTLLLIVALCVPSGQRVGDQGVAFSLGPTCLWAASPQPPQEKKPQWKSREEYDAYQAMAGEQDPNKKIQLAEAFLEKFKDTDFKDLAYVTMMQTYAQLNDSAKAMDAARQAVKANPDKFEALAYLSFAFPFVFKADAPEATAELSQAEGDAKHGLDLLQKLEKPASVTDEQFAQYVKGQRANFNNAVGFVALQRKDYAAGVTALKAAAEDNPSNSYGFYWLGLSHLNLSPRDYDNAIWNMARAISLAKAARDPNAEAWERYLRQTYIGYHGNDEGLADITSQAAASPTPPEGFKVAPMEIPQPTGNASIDGFNKTFFELKFGGERAQKLWDGLKGEPFGMGGFVESVERGSEPGVNLVRIDVLAQSKAADGVYDIELRDSTQPNVKNLGKGDAVHFRGRINAYTATPNLVITLDNGTINEDEIPDQPRVAPKPKPKPKPRANTPTRRTTRRPPG